MKYYITLFALLVFLLVSNAQNFEKAVGFRSGGSSAIYFETIDSDLSSTRYMLNWREKGRQFTAMKVFRRYDLDKYSDFQLGNIAGQLSFYYGYGAHAGYVKWDQFVKNSTGQYFDLRSAPVLGLDGLLGFSYDFKRLPISLTIDVKPYFDYWGRRFFQMNPFDIGIGAVYVF